jgi:hypothetical protein
MMGRGRDGLLGIIMDGKVYAPRAGKPSDMPVARVGEDGKVYPLLVGRKRAVPIGYVGKDGKAYKRFIGS